MAPTGTSFPPLKPQGPFSPPTQHSTTQPSALAALTPDCSTPVPPSAVAQPSVLTAGLADCTRGCAIKSHMPQGVCPSTCDSVSLVASVWITTQRVTDLAAQPSTATPSGFYLSANSLPTERVSLWPWPLSSHYTPLPHHEHHEIGLRLHCAPYPVPGSADSLTGLTGSSSQLFLLPQSAQQCSWE